MDTSNELSLQENILISRHLMELYKNNRRDIRDWYKLAVQHHQEIQSIGLTNFSNWNEHKNNIIQLASLQFEKMAIIKDRQSKELEEMRICR